MSWIELKGKAKVGEWVQTTQVHSHPAGLGYFEKGSLVQVIAVHPIDGYSISDISGHVVEKIGWII